VYSVFLAYFLWFLSGFGALGLHRFYLGKIGTGLLWFFTGGLGMVGGVYDLFALPTMVRESNYRLELQNRRALGDEYSHADDGSVGVGPGKRVPDRTESLEKTVLRIAKENMGLVSASEVALAGNVGLDEARNLLERLTANGFCEMRIRKSGTIAYYFPDFTDNSDFEDL
jgi:TM2 domain-containing membrane protein YozV